MNADRLLAQYEMIADAPDAIPRLRRFILDLAVRGKLVKQDPNDEPAAELLKRIAKEKKRLEKTKRIKKSEFDPVNEEVAPFSVPSLWQWTRLGTIGDWGAGSTPSRGNPDLYGGGLTWLKSGELNDNTQLRGSQETVTELAVQKGTFRLNRPGDILIAMYGATIGKLAILAEEAVTNQAVCGCTPFDGVFNKYLFLFLLSQRENFSAASEGGAQPNISKVKIVGTPFPLPPLAEQHRIVAKVDKLMSLCDRLEKARTERETTRDRLTTASLARLNEPDPDPAVFQNHAAFALDNLVPFTTRPDQIKALRQTILNLAVRGKLVEQDPNDEPAAELLTRIASEKARLVKAREIRKGKPLPVIGLDEFPFETPCSWEWVRIRNVMSDRGQTIPDRDFTYIDVTAINKEVGCIENAKVISASKAPSRARKIVRMGDVLYSCVRPYLLNIAIVESEISPSPIASTAFAVLNGFGLVLPRFQWIVLRSPFMIAGVEDKMRGQAYPAINDSDFAILPFPLPPLAEQHRIVAKVDELIALCDRLEASLTTRDDTLGRLIGALLHEALEPLKNGEAAA